MICEKLEVGQNVPFDTVYQDVDDGLRCCFRKCSEPKAHSTVEGDPEPGRVFQKSSSGIWARSPNVLCKVMWWAEELTDAATIRFISKNVASLPAQELMYDWIDQE